jgi:membrane-bound lytic murein transglycosylase F
MTRQRDQRIVGRDLSPYDAVVRSYAEPLGFDWRLVVAQMYHESGFDPDRRSFAGARGLLQVLPRTARELGVDPGQLSDPRVNVEAGVRYLDWTRARFPDLSVGEQLWFALASYNAGVGHVRDARRLARRQGLDPNRWFGNVERAMLQLSEPVHARAATHGYVRGREPVHYVDAIRDLYRAYVEHYEVLDKAES